MSEPFKLSGDNQPRLFVDIDDTLIWWKGPLGELSSEWEVNYSVYLAVKRFKEQYPQGSLIFWSTGGRKYAQEWVAKAAPDLADDRTVYLDKFPAIPFTGDTFIDDMPMDFPWANLATHPRDAGRLFDE